MLIGLGSRQSSVGTVELFQYVDDPKRAPGDFENAGFLGVPNSFLTVQLCRWHDRNPLVRADQVNQLAYSILLAVSSRDNYFQHF